MKTDETGFEKLTKLIYALLRARERVDHSKRTYNEKVMKKTIFRGISVNKIIF